MLEVTDDCFLYLLIDVGLCSCDSGLCNLVKKEIITNGRVAAEQSRLVVGLEAFVIDSGLLDWHLLSGLRVFAACRICIIGARACTYV